MNVLAKSVLFATGVALVGFAFDIIAEQFFGRLWQAEVVGNAITGILAGCVFFKYMTYRLNLSRIRAEQIANLNHNIRNALEAMLMSHYTSDDAQRLIIVREASGRIDTALTAYTAQDKLSMDSSGRVSATTEKTPPHN